MIEKGQKINDRYEIIKSIGEGGMANVYLAYDTILDRRVAVKILRGDLSNDEKFVRRFQREALSASSLTHPNIVEMYDVGEDNGIYYIIMEYIEGKTLKQLIKKRGALTLSEAIDIMLQITDGISEAHNSYIIHRDLKPQNIMIKEDGTIKITDFGIAMALNSTQLTQTNSVMGSVHYLPPEQASGKGSTIRSDIYSMGILFYELLTGSLPFKGDNAVEIALKQMRDQIPSVRKKNPSIPQSVENVIIKATAKNPKNRYSDSKEMHADLLTVLNDDRVNEEKIVFKYPEHEVDENTAMLDKVKEKTDEKLDKNKAKEKTKEKEKVEEVVEEKKEEDEIDDILFDKSDKAIRRTNVVIIVLAIIFTLIVIGVVVAILVLPSFTKIPDVKVPDVTDLTVVDAEAKLKKAGFEVKVETIKEENEKIEKGNVIKTEPQSGRSIKKGSTITLYESLGEVSYVVEDYTGSNYIEIQTLLKNMYELEVKIDKKDVDTSKDYDAQEIIGQSVPAGTKLGKGDEIILYIPNDAPKYPDMVAEGWTEDDVQEFCNKNGLSCDIQHVENGNYEENTIYYQSRSPKTPVMKTGNKYDLVIKIAIKPVEKPVESDVEEPEPTESSTEETQ